MAGTLSCCLNLPHPNSTSSTSKTKPSQPLWRGWEKEIAPAAKRGFTICVVGVAATLVIGAIEVSQADAAATAVVVPTTTTPVKVNKNVVGMPRWSEKRMCPPWRVNSLESIVPENLPRPSIHRRWKSVGVRLIHAPLVGAAVKSTNKKADCFSM